MALCCIVILSSMVHYMCCPKTNFGEGGNIHAQHAARAHPLSVSIYARKENFTSQNLLLQVLFPTSERWKDLMLCIPAPSYEKLLPWVTSFPALTSIHISFKDSEHHLIRDCGIADIVRSSPNITSIYTLPHHIPSLQIPLGQIERFYCLSQRSPSQCLKGLSALPNLRVCHLDYKVPSFNFLTLRCPRVYTPNFFECLGNKDEKMLPSLKFFEMEGGKEGDLNPQWTRADMRKLKTSRPDVRFFGNASFHRMCAT